MQSLFKKTLPWLILMIALMMLIFWFRVTGAAIVVDETGLVQEAFITDTRGKYQKIWRLKDGYFYTIPDLEGTFEIRCRGGKIFRHGYVTPHMYQKITVAGDGKCSALKRGQ
jgi:hypothetical protein